MEIYQDHNENMNITPVKSDIKVSRRALTPISENKGRRSASKKSTGKISSSKKRVSFSTEAIEKIKKVESSSHDMGLDLDASYSIYLRGNACYESETPTLSRLISNVSTPMQLKESMDDVVRKFDISDNENGKFQGNDKCNITNRAKGGVQIDMTHLLQLKLDRTATQEKNRRYPEAKLDGTGKDEKNGKYSDKNTEKFRVLTLGNFQEGIWLDYGDESDNVVGETKVIPFILRAPEDGQESYKVALERFPSKKGFHFVLEDGKSEECIAKFQLNRGESKKFRLAWTPTNPGAVRDTIHFKLSRGRLQVVVTGTARGISEGPKRKSTGKKSNKKKIPSKISCRKFSTPASKDKNITITTPLTNSSTFTKSSLVGSVSKETPLRMYDQNWATKQSEAFTTMLNFIFEPNHIENEIKDDTNQDGFVHATLLIHRQREKLRQKAVKCAEGMEKFQLTLKDQIYDNKLSARSDRNLSADLSLRHNISELLLSYSLEWLQLGLETIFRENIGGIHSSRPTGSPGQDVVKRYFQGHRNKKVLKDFIVDRIFNDPKILKKYTGGKCKVPSGRFEKKYKEELRQHSLYHIILLIAFLDRARGENLLETSPRLFSKDGVVKSTKDVLTSVNREYVHGEGNIVKRLSGMGFDASYTQAPIDEIALKIENISTDLRDGVRLTRLIELLNGETSMPLSKNLRIPVISRLNKLHNVKIALNAIKDAGVPNIDDVESYHIVDAHKLHVLKLLWSIISHFKIASLIDPKVLEYEIDSVRRFNKRKYSSFRFEHPLSPNCDHNVPYDDKFTLLLLEWCQEVCSFNGLSIKNFTTSFADGKAICCLVNYYHPGILRMDEIKLTTKDITPGSSSEDLQQALQNERCNWTLASSRIAYIGGIPNMHLERDSNNPPEEKSNIAFIAYLCSRLIESSKEIMATLIIQKCYRRYKMNKDKIEQIELNSRREKKKLFEDMRNRAATLIQAIYRQRVQRKVFVEKCEAVKIIQKACIEYLEIRRHITVEKKVILLQSYVRMRSEFKRFHRLKDTAALLQNRFRKQQFHLTRDTNTIILQKYVRGYLARKKANIQISQVILLQSIARGFLDRLTYQLCLASIIRIQAALRCRLCLQSFKQMKESALKIERAYTTWKISILKQYAAATIIQKNIRGLIQRKRWRTTYYSVLILQTAVRSFITRKYYLDVRALMITLQSWIRAKLARASFISMKQSAIIIQSAMRKAIVSESISRQRDSAQKIQLHFRGYLARRKYSSIMRRILLLQSKIRSYFIFKRSATYIQKYFRAYLARKEYITIIGSICMIQSKARAYLQLVKMEKKKRAGKLIIAKYRAWKNHLVMVKRNESVKIIQNVGRLFLNRLKFNQSVIAVVKIQSFWRGSIARAQYINFRIEGDLAACVIQKIWRGYDARLDFKMQIFATTIIQSYVRGMLTRRKVEIENAAACEIQRLWRGYNVRVDYDMQSIAATILQSYIRGMLTRSKTKKKISAACLIQSMWRGFKTRSEYNLQVVAVKIIQAHFRGTLTRKIIEENNTAACEIQRIWRGYNVRLVYCVKILATITIQSYIRGTLTRMIMENENKAAGTIQKMWRGYDVRLEYKMKILATTIIQSYVRGTLVRRKVTKENTAACTIQNMWRGYDARYEYIMQLVAIKIIQSYVRGMIARQVIEKNHIAACAIQKIWRGYDVRFDYKMQISAVIILQSYTRGMLIRRLIENGNKAASTIQKIWRGYNARLEYNLHTLAAVIIQCYFRGILARSIVQRKISAACIIQRLWRGYNARLEYSMILLAAVKIQSCVRGMLKKNAIEKEDKAACAIQRLWRGYDARLEYNMKTFAAVTIQYFWRVLLIKRQTEKENKAACMIQKIWRGYSAHLEYNIKILVTVKIQSRVRGMLTRKVIAKESRAACAIQRTWKGFVFYLKYNLMRESAIKIQSNARKMITEKSYTTKRKGIIKIQSLVKGRIVRSNFALATYSAILIQSTWRRFSYQNAYESVLSKIISLQAWFRSASTSRKYNEYRNSCITIQKVMRGAITRNFLSLRHFAACEIQSYWRDHLDRVNIKRKRNSALVIQSYYRGHVTRKYVNEKQKTAVLIQSIIRGFLARKKHNPNMVYKKSVIAIQSAYRGFRVRKIRSKEVRLVADGVRKAYKVACNYPERKLGNRTKRALYILTSKKSLAEINKALKTLELCTRLSKDCCIAFSKMEAAEKMYNFIQFCNRSVPHMELVTNAIQTLTNVTQYKHLIPYVGTNEAVNILVDLIQKFRPNPKIFNLVVELLEKLCKSNKSYLVQCTLPENFKRLHDIHKFFVKKKESSGKGFVALENIVLLSSNCIMKK